MHYLKSRGKYPPETWDTESGGHLWRRVLVQSSYRSQFIHSFSWPSTPKVKFPSPGKAIKQVEKILLFLYIHFLCFIHYPYLILCITNLTAFVIYRSVTFYSHENLWKSGEFHGYFYQENILHTIFCKLWMFVHVRYQPLKGLYLRTPRCQITWFILRCDFLHVNKTNQNPVNFIYNLPCWVVYNLNISKTLLSFTASMSSYRLSRNI